MTHRMEEAHFSTAQPTVMVLTFITPAVGLNQVISIPGWMELVARTRRHKSPSHICLREKKDTDPFVSLLTSGDNTF